MASRLSDVPDEISVPIPKSAESARAHIPLQEASEAGGCFNCIRSASRQRSGKRRLVHLEAEAPDRGFGVR